MAIIKLTDIVTVMKDKWTYGDKFFGFTEEFNDNHSTQYPSLLITPPTSVFPEVGIENGWENYTFEVYFSDLYNRTQQQNESIDQRWENLQDLGAEWLDNFLKNYQAEAPITAFLEDESVTLERNKEVANDQLLQIKMTFTWRVFSKCFRPQSTYPNQISGLTSWLRADSSVTFNIPTKKVSAVGDISASGNGVAQSTSSLQPLRYTYGGLLDKTILTFNSNSLISDNNFVTDGTTAQEFTIFEVSKIDAINQSIFGYFELSTGAYIEMGIDATGHFFGAVSDGTTVLTENANQNSVGKYHIGCLRKKNKNVYVDYQSPIGSTDVTHFDAAFDLAVSFESKQFRIGCTQESDGLLPPAPVDVRFAVGNLHEVIIYNRKLSDEEMNKVNDYLNKKYKIY
jgi:hypothetical protein